jgi:hypothetical protein
MRAAQLACKRQLRGTGCRAGLRSEYIVGDARGRVQFKNVMGGICRESVTLVIRRLEEN